MRAQIKNWIEARLRPGQPLVLGLNAPQGAGKTTLSHWLCEQFERQGLKTVTLSIDDFYLTRAEQMELARAHPRNPYLQQRGYPGTHDIKLGAETLRALKAGATVKVPRYAKSAHEGKGDRRPTEQWPVVTGPFDLIILEGWMLGFQPVTEKKLPNPDFRIINDALKDYVAWTSELNAFLRLKPDDYHHVLQWRVEAEEKMKASGRAGLSTADIKAYIALFLPAYETYLPTLEHAPLSGEARLTVPIGRGRLPP